MAYKKYETKGLIIDTFDTGEADKQILVLTRELGLIFAFAKSVRVINSKLRFSLSRLSVVDLVVVRGKIGWRITNVKEERKILGRFISEHSERTFLKILNLLKRMVQGEERNEELFDIINQTAIYLLKENDKETINSIETLSVLRILNTLGYVKDSDVLRAFIKDTDIDKNLLADIPSHKRKIISEINQAIEESHL